MACESSVIYRRRNLGKISVAAVAELVLFDAENPRSLAYQFERLRADLRALPGHRVLHGPSGWSTKSRPGCVGSIRPTWSTSATDGIRTELRDLLDGVESDLRELVAACITATQLSLPGGMQPLWGPDERRQMP